MGQVAAALGGSILTATACYAAGAALLARLGLREMLRRYEQVPLAFLLGAACLHLAIFAILALRIAYWPVLVAALLAAIGIAARAGDWRPGAAAEPLPRSLRITAGLCLAPFLVLYFVNALAPESSADGSGYHLGIVARYLRARGFEAITTNMYAALAQGIEALFMPAFAIGRHSAAALVHFCFLIALVLGMLAYARRIGKPWAGAAGAVLVFASPVVGRDATSAYIDAGAAAAAFASFYWLEIWDSESDARALIPAGLMAGYAYAAKYTAVVILLYGIGFLVMRSKRLAPVLTISGWSLVMIAPWMIRNWIWYHNPIAPLGNAFFPNPYFYILAEQDWAAWLRTYGLPNLRELPLEVTVRGFATAGIVGPVFLLAPLAVIAMRNSPGRRLLAAGAVMLAAYPANIGTRFLIPALPFVSLALGLAANEWRPALIALMLAHSIASWPAVIKQYAPGAWRVEHFPIRAALRIEKPDGYLRRVHPDYSLARMIEENVPKGEAVLGMSGAAESYTTRDVRVSFQSASNATLAEIVNMGWNGNTQPVRAWVFRFPSQRVQGLRVVQTGNAQYPEQWNVHELQFLSNGRELPRRPDWRISARPNPWDVQLAFDNSPVTRWRSWEVAQAGMYMQASFGNDETVDEVRVVTSPDYVRVRFRLEAESGGAWKELGGPATEMELGVPKQIRREAIHELSLRGVHYILIHSGEFGYEDFRDDPEGWGLKIVAEAGGAILYRSIW
jgi:hypothetical protein